MLTAILTVVGYLSGSMPWGYWLVRIFRGEDIRTQGSGNIGATNVWRVHGRRLGVPAVLLDTLKGFVPALLATQLVGHGSGVLAGAAAMLGHYRPIFLGFRKGGKMVATAGGAFLGVAPIVGGVALKGPADRMLVSLGHESSARGVARIYRDLATAFVLDTADAALEPEIAELGFRTLATDSIMADHAGRARLARTVLEFAVGIAAGTP